MRPSGRVTAHREQAVIRSPALHTRMGLAPHCREPLRRKEGDALLIVDIQNDFLPGGALGVPDGDAVIPRLNRCAAAFERDGLPIFASRDWHPPDHCSFRTQGGPWPTHCVAGTSGAEFPPTLVLPRAVAVRKQYVVTPRRILRSRERIWQNSCRP